MHFISNDNLATCHYFEITIDQQAYVSIHQNTVLDKNIHHSSYISN
ncbi:hypothetical protein Acav_0294 [Paracidovorax avenae ATCC 19860]|uniref:Uncharacterized protein n=1 Tax=Paracidovorax avenae (strain ATCC 19860 / DSM 7227 / CCUG 15838 / JCM 20985 / LMG 2117 / NCPPB 1011) TaxID=643561 RepID=F0Q2V8_PARA1|nr:hypothetical protein Acav_0294 [Paracidovorax avenae ATCC 19860]